MKKTVALFVVFVMMLCLCACAAAKIEASEARAWTKADWTQADEKTKIAALAAVIGEDRDDIDVERSAEISLEGFDEYFLALEDAALTLGEIYDLCTVQEVTE